MSSSSKTSVPPRGGMSIQPTPANNVEGGAAHGDSGVSKKNAPVSAEAEQRDSTTTTNAKISNADFSSLRDQKEAAEAKYRGRQAQAEPTVSQNSLEDRSFQYHKPGEEHDTLPGWDKIKYISKSLTGSG